MREILFRGKRADNGKWVEGELLHDMQNRPHLYWKTPKELPIVFSNHAIVDPATLGQFTGLTDKNGKKIFEGDIIMFNEGRNLPNSSPSPEVIFFDERNVQFTRYASPYATLQRDMMSECEVIGNIHDNSEMKEVNNG